MEQRRRLLTEVLPDVNEDELGLCSYVKLSSTYDPFADKAEQADWPVRRLESHHLAVLTAPAEVADALQEVWIRLRHLQDNG